MVNQEPRATATTKLQRMKRKRNKKRNVKSIMPHLYASTATKSAQLTQKTDVGNLRRMQLYAQQTGSQARAPEGARGQQ